MTAEICGFIYRHASGYRERCVLPPHDTAVLVHGAGGAWRPVPRKKPAFTYWTTGKGTRHEMRWRRCTTCGQPGTLPRNGRILGGCPYKALHAAHPGEPQYTGRTPSS